MCWEGKWGSHITRVWWPAISTLHFWRFYAAIQEGPVSAATTSHTSSLRFNIFSPNLSFLVYVSLQFCHDDGRQLIAAQHGQPPSLSKKTLKYILIMIIIKKREENGKERQIPTADCVFNPSSGPSSKEPTKGVQQSAHKCARERGTR